MAGEHFGQEEPKSDKVQIATFARRFHRKLRRSVQRAELRHKRRRKHQLQNEHPLNRIHYFAPIFSTLPYVCILRFSDFSPHLFCTKRCTYNFAAFTLKLIQQQHRYKYVVRRVN